MPSFPLDLDRGLNHATPMDSCHAGSVDAGQLVPDAINRICQRFIDCVHRLGNLENGRSRLSYLRKTGPATSRRS